jgi:hypothetical protein
MCISILPPYNDEETEYNEVASQNYRISYLGCPLSMLSSPGGPPFSLSTRPAPQSSSRVR